MAQNIYLDFHLFLFLFISHHSLLPSSSLPSSSFPTLSILSPTSFSSSYSPTSLPSSPTPSLLLLCTFLMTQYRREPTEQMLPCSVWQIDYCLLSGNSMMDLQTFVIVMVSFCLFLWFDDLVDIELSHFE